MGKSDKNWHRTCHPDPLRPLQCSLTGDMDIVSPQSQCWFSGDDPVCGEKYQAPKRRECKILLISKVSNVVSIFLGVVIFTQSTRLRPVLKAWWKCNIEFWEDCVLSCLLLILKFRYLHTYTHMIFFMCQLNHKSHCCRFHRFPDLQLRSLSPPRGVNSSIPQLSIGYLVRHKKLYIWWSNSVQIMANLHEISHQRLFWAATTSHLYPDKGAIINSAKHRSSMAVPRRFWLLQVAQRRTWGTWNVQLRPWPSSTYQSFVRRQCRRAGVCLYVAPKEGRGCQVSVLSWKGKTILAMILLHSRSPDPIVRHFCGRSFQTVS